MKPILILSALFLWSVCSFGQKAGNFYGSLKFGASIPVGEFASKKTISQNGGMATIGPVFNLEGGYTWTDHFGVMVIVTGQENGWDAKALAKYAQYQSSYNTPFNINPAGQWSATANKYRIGRALLGIHGDLPLGKAQKFFINPRFAFGGMQMDVPSFTVTHVLNSDTASYHYSGNSNLLAYSYMFGLGFLYAVCSNISIDFVSDFHSAIFNYPSPFFSTFAKTNENTRNIVSTINLNLGVRIRL